MLSSFRFAACLVSLVSLISLTATSQGLSPCLSTRVDSMIVGKDFNGAVGHLTAHPQDIQTTEEYLSLIKQVKSASSLPDSAVLPIIRTASNFKEKFHAMHAGDLASACFDEFLSHYEQKKYTVAYERYIVAQFLRLHHLQCERQRLRGNLELARRAYEQGRFEETRKLIALFKIEPPTLALGTLGDTLSRGYTALADQVNVSAFHQEQEERRQPISPTLFVAFGGDILASRYTLGYDQVGFRTANSAKITFEIPTGNAFSMTPFGYSIGMAYHLSPTLAMGVSYQHSGATQDGSFGGRTIMKYHAEMRSDLVDAWLKYVLDPRDGPRPYITVGGGYSKSVLIPEEVSSDPSRVYVERIEGAAMHLSGEVGAEYVPSVSFPLCLQGFAQGLVNVGGDNIVLKPVQFYLGLRLGFLI